VKLFMVETTTSDLSASIAWYSAVLGLAPSLLDEANGFALLEGPAGRHSLKRGTPRPGGVRWHYEVADLNAELLRLSSLGVRAMSEPKVSAEGYRWAVFHDPDGYEIALFEWIASG